jgi:hypothetical protein
MLVSEAGGFGDSKLRISDFWGEVFTDKALQGEPTCGFFWAP